MRERYAMVFLLAAACGPSSPPATGAGGDADAGVPGAGGASGADGGPAWRLIWSDEFEGASGAAVDASKWKFDLGNNNGWGNAELEDYIW